MRMPVAIALILLLATGCRSGIEMTTSVLPTEGDASQYAGDAGRRSSYAEDITLPLELVWQSSLSSPSGAHAPTVSGKTLLVPTLLDGIDIITARTGKEAGYVSTNGAILGAPAVVHSRMFMPVTASPFSLMAIDIHSGHVKWRASGEPVENPVLALDSNIITTGMFGTVTCYGLSDSTALWKRTLPGPVICAASGQDSTVFVACTSGDVYALSRTDGTTRWRFPVGKAVHVSPVTDGIRVFAVNRAGRCTALSANDGSIVWEKDLGIPLFAAPSLDDEILVVPGTDGVLRAYRPENGDTLWTTDLGTVLSGTPMLTPSYVITSTMNGRLIIAEKTTGDIMWSETVEGRIRTAPILCNGVVCIISDNGDIYGYAPTAP